MEHTQKPGKTILESLETHGLKPESHCRDGYCGMCRSKINPDDMKNITLLGEPLAFFNQLTEILPCVTQLSKGKLDIIINSTDKPVRILHQSETTLLCKVDVPALDEQLQKHVEKSISAIAVPS